MREGRCREFAVFGWKPEDTADPQAEDTFQKSKLNWPEVTRSDHAQMLDWHQKLIRLRFAEPALHDGEMDRIKVNFDELKRWLTIDRGNITIACNFSSEAQSISLSEAKYEILLTSSPENLIEDGSACLAPDSVAILKIKPLASFFHMLGRFLMCYGNRHLQKPRWIRHRFLNFNFIAVINN